MIVKGQSLENLSNSVSTLKVVSRESLNHGDKVWIRTCNSVYSVIALKNGQFSISGGRFDEYTDSPALVSISGCTWGGSIIKLDIIAACGLCIEFSNGIRTSIVQRIVILPKDCLN